MFIHPHFADQRHCNLIAAAETARPPPIRETASPAKEPPRADLEGLTLDHARAPKG